MATTNPSFVIGPMPGKTLHDDCFRTEQPLLTHHEALAHLQAAVAPVVGTEQVSLVRAHRHILAEPVIAPRNVPLTDNSAVDGYAFAHADYLAKSGRLPVAARIPAGHTLEGALPPAAAARIFTGAPMPAGADTVAMQEDCVTQGSDVIIGPGLKHGANCRRAGEDVRSGDTLVAPGTVLRPQELGAIASIGREAITCFKPLKVALVSTGDEIIRPGKDIAPGQVYDANFFLLSSLCETVGANLTDVGILPDQASALRAVLSAIAESHDLILTSGGASVGEEDHLVAALEALGERHIWKLAIKPGRPMTFGRIGRAVFLGLPGNPVAATLCFLNYARPVLMRMSGAEWPTPRHYLVPADFEITGKKTGRREFVRGIYALNGDATPVVRKYARDGSGIITSLREADGLIELAEDLTEVRRGDMVPFIPFTEYGLPSR